MGFCIDCKNIASFYWWGSLSMTAAGFMAFWSAYFCPYQAVCTEGFAALILTALFALTTGAVMYLVYHSLDHVKKLYIQDLTQKNMTERTKRCGSIARTCPCVSRWLFLFATFAITVGAPLAMVTCPGHDDQRWNGRDCGLYPPMPQVEFGFLLLMWIFVAGFACRAKRNSKNYPFLHEPVPEVEEFQAQGVLKACACCGMMSKVIHP
eukprot:gb/GFBE01013672.1/.p1 GENE.gb/GFBE01013672.1/~~gb/GFBE01013672.1/.p1  ORF type:complete len:208 (+),score=39.42 gb/GFBE01013672.1/:1-624(+)